MGFLAALSGFRAVVADLLWIQAHTAWENTDWGRMKLLFDTVTTLQPRAIVFWEGAAWHMAWNASVAALENRSEPRLALRVQGSPGPGGPIPGLLVPTVFVWGVDVPHWRLYVS